MLPGGAEEMPLLDQESGPRWNLLLRPGIRDTLEFFSKGRVSSLWMLPFKRAVVAGTSLSVLP